MKKIIRASAGKRGETIRSDCYIELEIKNLLIALIKNKDIDLTDNKEDSALLEIKKSLNSFTLEANQGVIKEKEVIGVLGENGIGKTTAIEILSGALKPNLGGDSAEYEDLIDFFKGTETQLFFEKTRKKEILGWIGDSIAGGDASARAR